MCVWLSSQNKGLVLGQLNQEYWGDGVDEYQCGEEELGTACSYDWGSSIGYGGADWRETRKLKALLSCSRYEFRADGGIERSFTTALLFI